MVFGTISGLCLAIIGLRRNGRIPPDRSEEELDSLDKYLALIALIFFIAMISLIIRG
jgi:hypothetical protein